MFFFKNPIFFLLALAVSGNAFAKNSAYSPLIRSLNSCASIGSPRIWFREKTNKLFLEYSNPLVTNGDGEIEQSLLCSIDYSTPHQFQVTGFVRYPAQEAAVVSQRASKRLCIQFVADMPLDTFESVDSIAASILSGVRNFNLYEQFKDERALAAARSDFKDAKSRCHF